ncbi:AAA family ATPase [Sphaerisporangium sp. NPDC088356]|uniref:helix-turn-helix transcriptional regulator n=1 Tax=Sphaerisporangium sp. NPDC088356 TaxID=3154871 RepID=UPI0034385D82
MLSGQQVLHRDIELRVIQEALSNAYAGKPSVLVILGPKGIGKTTLLHAALAEKPDARAILTARGHPAERDFPFGVVRQLFDPLTGGTPPAEPASAPLIVPGHMYEAQGSGLVAPDLLQSLYRATRSITGTQPLIIAIDDANHADAQSAQWCSYIARRLDGLPIVMILTIDSQSRGGHDLIRDIGALPYARLLRPAPLCHRCTGQLLESAMSAAIDAEVAEACHQLTQGNPLLLHQLAGQLITAKVSPDKTELPRMLEMGATSLTETALGWLLAHDPASVDLLRSLAILAPDDGLETAAVLSGFGQLAAREAGETLRRAGLLVGSPPDRFVHQHIQQTILAGMDPSVRDDLHRRAASLLYRFGAPVNRSARHLMSATPTGDPWTVTILREAARDAVTDHAWEPATRYLHRALAESDDPAVDLEITAELGAVEMQRDLPACLRRLRTVFGRVRLAPQKMSALAPFADILVTANSAEAGGIFGEAVQLAAETPAAFGTDLLFLLGAQAMLWGQSAGVLRKLGRSMQNMATPQAREFLSALALVTGVKGRNLTRTLALTRRCFDGKGVVPLGAVLPLVWGDRIDEASYWSERVVTEARNAASDTRLVMSLVVRSEVRYQLGSLEASLRDATEAARLAELSHTEGFSMAATANAARALVELGALDVAESLLRSVDPYGGDCHPLISGHIMDALGRLYIAQGRPRDGLRILLDCGRRLTSSGITNPACVPWGTNAILAYMLFGERTAARATAERELELARAWGAPTTIGRALSAGSVAYEGTARLDMLHEAVDLLRNRGARLEYTRALIRLGIALRQNGDEHRARETLTAGLDLAVDCGAVRLASLADKHLATAGIRPAGPGARPSGARRENAHPLTTGERRVTDLVLQGMSNLEVATILSISKRTVDTHLARIYRKLGIHTRAELVAILTSLTADTPADLDLRKQPPPTFEDHMEYRTVL